MRTDTRKPPGTATSWLALASIIDEVLAKESGKVDEYRSGKDKLFGFFVGAVMRESKGKANPALVNEILLKKLKG